MNIYIVVQGSRKPLLLIEVKEFIGNTRPLQHMHIVLQTSDGVQGLPFILTNSEVREFGKAEKYTQWSPHSLNTRLT